MKLFCSQCGSRSFTAYVMVKAKYVSDFEGGIGLAEFEGLKG